MLFSLFTLSCTLLTLCAPIAATTIQVILPDPDPALLYAPHTAGASRKTLPPCSPIDRPCQCPKGTTFRSLSTITVIGANAHDVYDVAGSFSKTEWSGVTVEVTGKDNTVGSVRRYSLGDDDNGKPLILAEELTGYTTHPDGSFKLSYAQHGDYLEQLPSNGGGIFRGFWLDLIVQQSVAANETVVNYRAWRCDIGRPYTIGPANEGGLRNISFILFNEGKLPAPEIAPYTVTFAD